MLALLAFVALTAAQQPRIHPDTRLDSAADTSTALRPSRIALDLRVDVVAKRVDGSALVTVTNVSDAPVRTVPFLLYRMMRVSKAYDASGAPVAVRQRVVDFLDDSTWQARQVIVSLPRPIAPHDSTTVRVEYGGHLAGYAETSWSYVHDRIDSVYSLLRMETFSYPELVPPSHTMARKLGSRTYDYDARITVPQGYVVANGGEELARRDSAGWTSFAFRNIKPAWRMDFAVARFTVLRDGLVRVYQLPADSLGGARVLRDMQRGLALFSRWFGPLRDQRSFAIIELPDGWGSQADVTSILQTAAAFRDSLGAHELYHEISHLWNVRETEPAPARWQEGLASFLEDVGVDSLNGRRVTDRNAQWFVGSLRGRVARDRQLATIPMRDYGRHGDMTDDSYSVGWLMFYVMYRVMGHEPFVRLVREYDSTYAQSGGSIDQLAAMTRRVSPVPLDTLFDDWMRSVRWTKLVASMDAAALVAHYAAPPR